MRGKPLNPLPDIDTLKAAYYRTGSIRAASRALHVAQWRVSQALFEAGLTRSAGRKPRSESILASWGESRCNDCRHATAIDCEFLAAARDDVGEVLDRLNLQYIANERTYRNTAGNMTAITVYTVISCPRYMAGELPAISGSV